MENTDKWRDAYSSIPFASLPHADEEFFSRLDSAYYEAFERLEAGDQDDERGARVMGGLTALDPACFRHQKHVDWVLERNDTYTIDVTKMGVGAQGFSKSFLAEQTFRWDRAWDQAAVVPDDFPGLIVGSDVAPRIDILGKPTLAGVDAGIDLGINPGGWRVVLEVEINNFLRGNKRMHDYMRGWPWLRVGVVINLSDHREDGTWAGLASVWRRDDEDRPMLDRVFEMGTTRNPDDQNYLDDDAMSN